MIFEDRATFAPALPNGALPPLADHAAVPAPGARLSLLAPASLTAADQAVWDDLGANSATPSVFAQPWFTRAGLACCAGDADVRLAVVIEDGGNWLGVVPVIARARYGKAPFPHWALWSHPNQFRGTPLVQQGHEARFWRALLDGLGRAGRGRLALRLTGLPLDEPVVRALVQVCADDRRGWKTDRLYDRALLARDQLDEGEALKGSRRRRIASLERKCERELGPLAWRVAGSKADVAAALDRFLALESAGWKGRAGSALASATATRDFFAAVTSAAAARGLIEVTELLAGGRLIAASVHFVAGDEGFGFKMAYDEGLGGFGPGLLLLSRLTAHFRDAGPPRVDSCCAPGQEPIGSLWPQRLGLVDCGIALGGPLRRRALGWLDRLERLYHRC
ncbi:MAG: GNAT family N-acetyltransferase [Sphingomonadales bacterium]|nr:GNAT family N-acetyltransferase [Sphingomonadales bacterium]